MANLNLRMLEPRIRRARKGQLEVQPSALLKWFGDPHMALGAAVLIEAAQALGKPHAMTEARQFLESDWAKVVAQVVFGEERAPQFWSLLNLHGTGKGFESERQV